MDLNDNFSVVLARFVCTAPENARCEKRELNPALILFTSTVYLSLCLDVFSFFNARNISNNPLLFEPAQL